MAAKRTRKDTSFLGTLRALGCEYCRECRQYMYPGHKEHARGVSVDLHESRYEVQGGYGNTRLVEKTA